MAIEPQPDYVPERTRFQKWYDRTVLSIGALALLAINVGGLQMLSGYDTPLSRLHKPLTTAITSSPYENNSEAEWQLILKENEQRFWRGEFSGRVKGAIDDLFD